jgi:16S rRNA (uracil1498-N3)-methyltransferase
MEKIVLSAAKQSRKLTFTKLQELTSPNTLITETRRHKPDTMVFCCHLDNTSTPLTKNYSGGKDVLMLIGPEGGFTNEETEQMMMRGAQMITLGPFRLRVETAAIMACHSVHIINDLKLNI